MEETELKKYIFKNLTGIKSVCDTPHPDRRYIELTS